MGTELFIHSWAAISPGISSREEWQAWMRGDIYISSGGFESPKIPQIPAMLRRRLSPMGKTSLACAFRALDNAGLQQSPADSDPQCPPAMVFCSQHGEIDRTLSMLQGIVSGQGLSPTAFSLSVHNAIAGIYSMASSHTGNITALSAGPDGVCAALVEAAGLLYDGAAQVLCLIYDQALPDFYPEAKPSSSLALAILLAGDDSSGSEKIEFELRARPEDKPESNSETVNLEFIRFLLQPSAAELNISLGPRDWFWSKPGTSR